MKRVGGSKWIRFRKEILSERGYICEKCGKRTKKLVLDHIYPISLYGREFDPNNVQLLCRTCNLKKTKIDLSNIHFLNRFQNF